MLAILRHEEWCPSGCMITVMVERARVSLQASRVKPRVSCLTTSLITMPSHIVGAMNALSDL